MKSLQHLRLAGREQEVAEKHRRVVEYLDAHQLDGVLLSRRDSFAWYTGGGDNHIPSIQEGGVATLWITREGAKLWTSNIEAARVKEEELAGVVTDVEPWHWYEDSDAIVRSRIAGKAVVSDTGMAGTENRFHELRPLRYVLTEQEREHLRRLGRIVGEATEWATRGIRIGETEHQIGARLCRRLLDFGIEPTVNLVAVDERIFRYRHPIPTGKTVENYAMLITCARSGGLIVAVTRLVHFGRIPAHIRERYDALLQVEAALFEGTLKRLGAAEVLRMAQDAYARVGYDGEWKFHHQGGAIGYDNREWLATPDSKEQIHLNQAFAWNPSLQGTKVEDTIVLEDSGLSIVTETGDWPMQKVQVGDLTLLRPDILERTALY